MTHRNFILAQVKSESMPNDVFELESEEIFSENYIAEYNKITKLEGLPLDQWITF